MQSKEIEIKEATSSDIEAMGQIFSHCFLDVAPGFFPFGLTEKYVNWRTSRLRRYHSRMEYERNRGSRGKSPLDETHLLKASIKETGEIVGFLYFTIEPKIEKGAVGEVQKQKRKEREDNLPEVVPKLPEGTDESRWLRFVEVMDEAKEKHVGNKAYVSIEILGVSAKYRGVGTGPKLMKHCFQTVSNLLGSLGEASDLPFFLCATPLAVPMYERMGFKLLEGLPDAWDENRSLLHAMIKE